MGQITANKLASEMNEKRTWLWLVAGWIAGVAIAACGAVPPPTAGVTLSWSPVTNAASYNILAGTNSGQYSRTNQTVSTNAVVSNLVQMTRYWFTAQTVASNGAVSTNASEISAVAGDTNVYVTNWILQPWYQAQYGQYMNSTNWASFGIPFPGQFTNLSRAFMRLLLVSNQVIGMVIFTNPPPDTGTVSATMPVPFKLPVK